MFAAVTLCHLPIIGPFLIVVTILLSVLVMILCNINKCVECWVQRRAAVSVSLIVNATVSSPASNGQVLKCVAIVSELMIMAAIKNEMKVMIKQ